ncbi:MAG: hypothetical protein Q4G43_06530 [Mobilicoccus sp.]|nr:hypothetical protein [Mobilicoccus sp.]
MTGLFLVLSFLLGFGLSWLYMVRSVTRTMPTSRRETESAATRYYRRRGATATAPPEDSEGDEVDEADDSDTFDEVDGRTDRDRGAGGGSTRVR